MKRVLVADDASFMRQMIRDIIEPEGYEVVGEASDGVEVVEKFRELQPDLVMMDIVMPKRSGIDSVKAICAEAPTAWRRCRPEPPTSSSSPSSPSRWSPP
jgi:two-component system chemotaxis response regulator CheY